MIRKSLCEAREVVNRAVRDIWIEAYLEALERWRLQAGAQGIVLARLRVAWRAYGKYRTSGDRAFRWKAWRSIQAAAASLRPSANSNASSYV